MGVALDDVALQRFSTYLGLLQTWGRKINLTTLLESKQVVVYHFLDSLAGAPAISATPHGRVVDLGAGAGLPSFALKFALPGLRLLLVESVRKKISFCQTVIRTTGIADTEALWGRGEDIGARPGHRHCYDWAVSRALGNAADVARLADDFLVPGGRVLLYKGEPAADELQALDTFCSGRGATWVRQALSVPHLVGARSLVTITFPLEKDRSDQRP